MSKDEPIEDPIGPEIRRQLAGATFTQPAKKINLPQDMAAFQMSPAYERILWVLQRMSIAVSGKIVPQELPASHEAIAAVVGLLDDLEKWVDEIPPKTGPRRFGNVAFRDWNDRLAEQLPAATESRLAAVLTAAGAPDGVLAELAPYLAGAFGSRQRMDYGTGHEVSFVAFVGGLMMLGAVPDTDFGPAVLFLFDRYLRLVRRLILTYTLEPAGSHGAWGLDDHSHVPYILGSAQLVDFAAGVDRADAPPTRTTADRTAVQRLAPENLYYGAVRFIYDVKRGPFHEHSPMLYDISGVATWTKVHRGMVKMYIAEVLGKFPVIQHFVFGTAFYPLGS